MAEGAGGGVSGTFLAGLRSRSAPVVCLIAVSCPALAEVTSSVENRTHPVPGTTARAVVRHMLRHPFPGDHGAAFANIRPHYRLTLDVGDSGRLCRVEDVGVSIRFVVTLPVAADRARMTGGVRAAWDEFASFARRHEETHKQSYLSCARAFVSRARIATATTCSGLRSEVRRMFDEARRSCEARQVPFDRQQSLAVRRLRLFDMAGY